MLNYSSNRRTLSWKKDIINIKIIKYVKLSSKEKLYLSTAAKNSCNKKMHCKKWNSFERAFKYIMHKIVFFYGVKYSY